MLYLKDWQDASLNRIHLSNQKKKDKEKNKSREYILTNQRQNNTIF
jgi:hypothetical protein